MRALTEFLLRESLTLLLDDPTPRVVAQAMGGAYANEAAALALALESQTEDASEDSEFSQLAAPATARVVMVRSTKSTQQTITIVDRSFSVEAFVPHAVVDELRTTRQYKSLARLRGSVVRIDRYHFATPAQCRAMQPLHQQPPRSVSTRRARQENAKLWLCVDALTVIDESELAVNDMPDLEQHDAVAKQLRTLTPEALAQRLALRQGLVLPTAPSTEAAVPETKVHVVPSPAKMFNAHNPLLDEDCEIPEDQARELDALEGWNEHAPLLAEPTDSQLIAENGPVSGSGESQPASSGNTTVSSSGNTVVSSSSDAVSPDPTKARIVVLETEPQTLSSQSPSLSRTHALADDGSVPDSQESHFQHVNLKKAFIECSDTDSDNEEYTVDTSRPTDPPATATSQRSTGMTSANTQASSQATESQSFSSPEEVASSQQQPLTQAMELSGDRSLPDDPTPSAEELLPPLSQSQSASQAAGEFVGTVRPDHDEPMTQVADDDSPVVSQGEQDVEGIQTQAPDPSPSLEIPSDQETVDVEYEMAHREDEAANADDARIGDAEADDDELEDRPTASQQDGQADHWMDTQPPDASPSHAARRRRSHSLPPPPEAAPSDTESPNVTQRRKRRRTLVPTAASQPLSPREPNAKAAAVHNPAPTRTAADATATAASRPMASGISAFNRNASNPQLQRLRPSVRYQHLLPPFDWDTIREQIRNKHE